MGKKILTNEQTKMSELTKYKLNAFGDTEDDIMHNIGFYKVYMWKFKICLQQTRRVINYES